VLNLNKCEDKKTLFHIFYDRVKQKYFFRNINSISEKNMIYKKINSYTIDTKAYVLVGDVFCKIEVNSDKYILI
jgi:hypothetical protein